MGLARSRLESTEPDLDLRVTQKTLPDGRKALHYLVKARDPELKLYYKSFESKPFLIDPQHYFRDFFHDISQLQENSVREAGRGAQGLAQRQRQPSEETLANCGAQLFQELLPLELQRRLWASMDSIQTVQILSDEAWIPWEILRLQDPDGSSFSDCFLAEAFTVSRWQLERDLALRLPLRRIALVTPSSDLPMTRAERDFIKQLAGPSRSVVEIPPVKKEIKSALASGKFDGWHFAGHGLAMGDRPQHWSLLLERGEQLSALDLYGEARQLGKARPFVFLNACHSGRGAASLTDMGGLAAAFLKAGAGAFLGSYWGVHDDAALFFAREFYNGFFSGLEIGHAVHAARMNLKDQCSHHLDWLAYTLFAHPLARCPVEGSGKPRKRKSTSPLPPSPATDAETSRKEETVFFKAVTRPAKASPRRSPTQEPREITSSIKEDLRAPGEERINLKDGTVLVFVPGGEYLLGAADGEPEAQPVHRVVLSPFWIGKFPVTNRQYAIFLADQPGTPEPAYWNDPRFNPPDHPVVGVSWEEAQAYCRWAGLELPSEAQWEAAARGGDQRPYPWGREVPKTTLANFGGVREGTAPVGSYPLGAGPFGTLDQAGNVWEWCLDPWSAKAYQERREGRLDPVATVDSPMRTLRGGSWNNSASDLVAFYRGRISGKKRLSWQGFRCRLS